MKKDMIMRRSKERIREVLVRVWDYTPCAGTRLGAEELYTRHRAYSYLLTSLPSYLITSRKLRGLAGILGHLGGVFGKV